MKRAKRVGPIQKALLLFALSAVKSPAARAEVAKSVQSPASVLRAAGLTASALDLAMRAYHRAGIEKLIGRERLTIIDYSLPSTQRRLWVIDPGSGEVLFAERVAHGTGSGELVANRFGNLPESHRSSLGVFRTGETYQGAHGYSLRLDGLDKGVNDRARARDIVFHSASYATEEFGLEHGRLGRSFGCPALDPKVARAIIDEIRGGSIVVAVGSDTTS